jgi:hypothetical protein
MKRAALIAAGVIAFDLGVMVVSSHAATDDLKIGKANAVTAPAPAKTPLPAKAEDISLNFLKIDLTNTLATCKAKGGTPATQNGVKGCLLPGKGGAAAISEEARGGYLASYKTH